MKNALIVTANYSWLVAAHSFWMLIFHTFFKIHGKPTKYGCFFGSTDDNGALWFLRKYFSFGLSMVQVSSSCYTAYLTSLYNFRRQVSTYVREIFIFIIIYIISYIKYDFMVWLYFPSALFLIPISRDLYPLTFLLIHPCSLVLSFYTSLYFCTIVLGSIFHSMRRLQTLLVYIVIFPQHNFFVQTLYIYSLHFSNFQISATCTVRFLKAWWIGRMGQNELQAVGL